MKRVKTSAGQKTFEVAATRVWNHKKLRKFQAYLFLGNKPYKYLGHNDIENHKCIHTPWLITL